MKTFLGVDGGGTKTDFLLIDATGAVLASHRGGSAYYLESGFGAVQAMLAAGIHATLKQGGIAASDLGFAFLGLPAYGEDRALLPRLDGIVADVLPAGRYRCDNDVVCGWAGALGASDGINIVAGTGSIAYGEFRGRAARAGGWGELFSDEGSAYWIAREGLSAFSRMSDGREPKGVLYDSIRQHFRLDVDLDVCAAVYGPPPLSRSALAALAPLVEGAARQGDFGARRVFERAAQELAAVVHAVRGQLDVAPQTLLPVSHSGGMFRPEGLLKPLFEGALDRGERRYEFLAPRLSPVAGAALYAAKLAGAALSVESITALARSVEGRVPGDSA